MYKIDDAGNLDRPNAMCHNAQAQITSLLPLLFLFFKFWSILLHSGC